MCLPVPLSGAQSASIIQSGEPLGGQTGVGAARLFGAPILGGTSGLTACTLRMVIAWAGCRVMPVGLVVPRSSRLATAILAAGAAALAGSPPSLDDGRTWAGILAMAGICRRLGHGGSLGGAQAGRQP